MTTLAAPLPTRTKPARRGAVVTTFRPASERSVTCNAQAIAGQAYDATLSATGSLEKAADEYHKVFTEVSRNLGQPVPCGCSACLKGA
jgi:hypothetical protein